MTPASGPGNSARDDTDERWDGLPGRALVFRTGGAPAAEPSTPESETATAGSTPPGEDPDGLPATLDRQLATMKLSRTAMGKRYEKTVRKILDGYKALVASQQKTAR